ncbi:hypothetical protein Esti_000634 [Eimeria stiedai]
MEAFNRTGPASDLLSLETIGAEVTGSAPGSSLSRSPQPLWRVRERSFLGGSFAVFGISLTLVYLLWGCLRHLSTVSKEGGMVRALATGDSKRGECFDDKSSSAGGTQSRSGEVDVGAGGGHAKDRRDTSRPSEHQGRNELAGGGSWGHRRMPSDWVARTRTTLEGWNHLAATCLKLLGILSPQQSVILVSNMTAFVAVELSGFGYIPDHLQRFRQKAGASYVFLIEKIFSTQALCKALTDEGLRNHLHKMRALILKIVRRPPEDELMSQKRAKATLTKHWSLSTDALRHVQSHLDSLLPDSQQARPPAQIDMVFNVIQAVGKVRKRQILGDSMLRRWLGSCHKESHANLYTREEYGAGEAEHEASEEMELAEIAAAVVHAGGRAEGSVGSTHSEGNASFSRSTEVLAQPPLPHTDDSAGTQSQHIPVSPEGMPSSGLLSPGAADSAPKKHASGFIDALQLSRAIQRRQSVKGSGALKGREGRHEQRVLHTKSAEALGWGPGRMPLAAIAQLSILTTRIEKTANCCLWVLNFVSPELAVQLALNVTKLATMEMAGLFLAPQEIQPGRRNVRRTYAVLLQTLEERERLLEAVGSLGFKETIAALGKLLEEVTRTPTTGPIETVDYLVFMVNYWRACKLSSQQLSSVLNSLIPSKTRRVGPYKVRQALAAVEALYEVRKKQLLSEPRVRQWLDSCQKNVASDLLFTQRELDEACQSEQKSSALILKEIAEAIQDVTDPSQPTGTSDPYPSSAAEPSATGARIVPRKNVPEESRQRARAPSTSDQPPFQTSSRARRYTIPPFRKGLTKLTRVSTQTMQPPIARPSRPQPLIDPTIRHPHQISQQYPSAPASPAPVIQLPDVYYQVFPQMFQTYDFSTRALSEGGNRRTNLTNKFCSEENAPLRIHRGRELYWTCELMLDFLLPLEFCLPESTSIFLPLWKEHALWCPIGADKLHNRRRRREFERNVHGGVETSVNEELGKGFHVYRSQEYKAPPPM